MLTQLSIHDFALIADSTVHFGPGFTAITGETGAGKSVLMKALRVACGEKTTAAMLRNGESKAWVEATFDISMLPDVKAKLETLGVDTDDELVIRREISAGGKSRGRVNGAVVTVADLQEIADALVQMHGQSDQILLRDVRTQQRMLDDFCGNGKLLAGYAQIYSEWTFLKEKRTKTEETARSLAQQKDFLTFQRDELVKAALKEGEEEELEEKTSAAARSESQTSLFRELRGILENENGLLDQFRLFQSKVRGLSSRIPEYAPWNEKLEDAATPLQEMDAALEKTENRKEMSPEEIDRANARLALIQRLKRKYRTDVNGLIALRAQREKELGGLENLDADLAELDHQIQKAEAELARISQALSDSRKKGASQLDSSVEANLHELGMPKASFRTGVEKGEFSPTGADTVEFYIAPNPGEGEKPLRLAVSGGELSRVLLAFKTVLADLDKVPLLVFDEVDAGISGEIGNNIGEALRRIGQYHQVLTITHLHQVASRAENHLAVSKKEIDGRTYSSVVALNAAERVQELARMLGDARSSTVQAHARELLEEANAS
ncbi:MAG: DNA repair protein RecN [Fibrobacteraceae bacterium]